MKIQLIQGKFSANDALELITNMINIKIKYHENQVVNNISEEDIKSRESKIKQLQKELFEIREFIHSSKKNLEVESIIKIE